MTKCLYCAEEIQDEAIKCKHCGEWIKEPPTQAIDPNKLYKVDDRGRSPLAQAAADGNTTSVKSLLASGSDVNARDNNLATPLMEAANRGYLDCATALLAAGADVNAKAANGTTPLMASASGGNAEIVKSLLDYGANVNERLNNGVTALHVAAAKGNASCVSGLIALGADPYAKNTNGGRPLDVAIRGQANYAKTPAATRQKFDEYNSAITTLGGKPATHFDPAPATIIPKSCIVCGAEAIQSVSGLVDANTGQSSGTGIGLAAGGLMIGAGSGTNQSNLAMNLACPGIGCSGSFLVICIVVGIIMSLVGLAPIGLPICFLFSIALINRLKTVRIETAIWIRLYYCHKCARVFDPVTTLHIAPVNMGILLRDAAKAQGGTS